MEKACILSLQYNPILGNKKGNIEKVTEIIHQYSDRQLDLVVLPEFFSTGICDEAFINAPEDEKGGNTIIEMRAIAKRYKTNIIAGTVITKDGGNRYNTSFAINREGNVIAEYKKIHLYNFAGGNEDKYITPGDKIVVADFDFAKVGMSICFDIKFPLHYNKLIKSGAEIIASPSGWITMNEFSEQMKSDFIKTWQAMNMTRASETLTYFVTSNLVGLNGKNLFAIGNSMICDPMGTVVAGADTYESGVYAELDLSIVRDFKRLYPIAEMD